MVSTADNEDLAVCFRNMTEVEQLSSERHQITIYQHPELGQILVLDGEVQHVERWAPLYHEPLIHLAVAFVPIVRTALILGGGSLFAAHELLKYNSLEKVVILDHDEMVVKTVAQHYPHARVVLKDQRVDLRFTDAWTGLADLNDSFDIIINDAFDLLSVSDERKYDRLESMLSMQGVCSDVVYRHLFYGDYASRTLKRLGRSSSFALSLVFVPEYPGILHLLTVWGKSQHLSQDLVTSSNLEHRSWIAGNNPNPCVYFDPRYLRFYLYLPPLIRTWI